MFTRSKQPIVPRNGHTLHVGVVARISGCASQREQSLEDQKDRANQDFDEVYDGPIEFHVISSKAKGERIDRPELEEIEAALRSRKLDFMWFEDLARLVRGEEAVRLMGIGVDHGTHSICPHDGLDTREPTWHQDALNACAEHVAHQEHTSRRLKIKLMNRFRKFGGAPGRPIAGYLVPAGAKTYAEWNIDAALTGWIREGKNILKGTHSGEAVAEFFNRVSVPVGHDRASQA